MTKIAIIGSGSWGTALAIACARANNNNQVILYGRNTDCINDIKNTHYNNQYLPNIAIDPSIIPTTDLKLALKGADIIILAIPSHGYFDICHSIKTHLDPVNLPIIVMTSKGFADNGSTDNSFADNSNIFLSSTITNALPTARIAMLSGPNFAADVALGNPIATTIAAVDINISYSIAKILNHKNFRAYPSDDLTGTMLCGGLKNIYAIGGGIIHGLDFSPSSESFYISRALTEMRRIIKHFGGKEKTLLTPAGVGDLVMCCQNLKSRNMQFGWNIAKNGLSSAIDNRQNIVVEGLHSLKVAFPSLHKLDIPIIDSLHKIVINGQPVPYIMEQLLNRDIRID